MKISEECKFVATLGLPGSARSGATIAASYQENANSQHRQQQQYRCAAAATPNSSSGTPAAHQFT